jgi:hypothetical protein
MLPLATAKDNAFRIFNSAINKNRKKGFLRICEMKNIT